MPKRTKHQSRTEFLRLISLYVAKLFLETCTVNLEGGGKEKGLQQSNLFPNKPFFLRVSSTSPLKTLREKEKLLVMSNFSFPHSVFYPFRALCAIFIKFEIVVCNFFQIKICRLGKG